MRSKISRVDKDSIADINIEVVVIHGTAVSLHVREGSHGSY